jgi:hypothetical protein
VNTFTTPETEATKRPRRFGARVLIPFLGVAVLAAHGLILYKLSAHAAVSAAVVALLVILLLIKHLGVIGSLYSLYQRRVHPGEHST